MDPVAFERQLPSFGDFVKRFSIEPSVAFHLWRPILAEKIKRYDTDFAIQKQKQKLLDGLWANENSTEEPNNKHGKESEMQDVKSGSQSSLNDGSESLPGELLSDSAKMCLDTHL